MLVLFDIDGTLLLSEGVGVAAIRDAGRRLHGDALSIEGVQVGGGLDPVILSDILRLNGVEPTHDALSDFKETYERALASSLAAKNTVHVLPGADELVNAVASHAGMTSGVMTGNYEATGTMKLEHGGFAIQSFEIRVWGDDSPECPVNGRPVREHLPPVALSRYEQRFHRTIDPREVVVIGDTVRDVECARSVGARCLAVSTGHVSGDDLTEAGADRVVDSLADTAAIMQWMETA